MVGLVLASQALAASEEGQLTRVGCYGNYPPATCDRPAADYGGLDLAQSALEFTQGGASYVITTASNSHTISLFGRDPDGQLTRIGCTEDANFGSDVKGCSPSGSSALEGVRWAALYGTDLYTASANDGVVGVYTVNTNPNTGAGEEGLTWKQNATGTAMSFPTGVVVSPDGKNVYVTSSASNALVTFTRAGDGTLSFLNCINTSGAGGCTGSTKPIDLPHSVLVSPDGRFVYVSTQTSDSVVAFSRDASTGALTNVGGAGGCVSQTGTGGACVDGRGLEFAYRLAFSPDASQIYVAGAESRSIAVLQRNATDGTLSQAAGVAGCVAVGGDDGCGTAVGLSSVRGVSVSPDGRNVYAAAGTISGVVAAPSDAVTVFARDASTGALTQLVDNGCIANAATTGCTTAPLLDSVTSVDVSEDGTFVFATVGADDNVTTFRREVAPVCTAGSESTPFGTAKTITLTCADANGDAITRSVGSPVGGTLSAVNGDQVTFTPTAGFAGAGSFTLTATETGGTGLASAPVTIDVAVGLPAAPDTAISSGPSGTTSQTAATFAFSSPTATATGFECRVDGAAFAACTSPATVTVGEGAHTFEVRAVDGFAQSDASPAQRAWTVDLTAPDTSLASSVSGTTSETTAVMTFSSEPGATFQCQLDGGAFEACTSPRVLTGLAAGSHVFLVRAIDGVGNVDASPATQTWTVAGTLTPPNQTDTKAPKMALLPRIVRLNARGVAAIRVTCPADETRCVGTLTLRKIGKTAKQRTVLGTKVFSVKGGKTVTVRIALGKAAIAALTKAGSLKVSAIAKATDAAGNTRTTTVRVTLKPKAKKALKPRARKAS
ncbi:MAG: beta-propeller fold lactonase family protein [Thermoleophilia bacterium]